MYIFETDGDYVNFNGGGNLWRIHKNSQCIAWHWDETGDLFFDVYDQQYVVKAENIATVTIGGVTLSTAADFETNIKLVFPGLAGGSAKVYIAFFSQTGIDPLTFNVMENTIGAVTSERAGVGGYKLTSAGLFTNGKTFIPGGGYWSGTSSYILPVTSGAAISGYIFLWVDSDENTVHIDVTDNTFGGVELSALLGTSKLPIQIFVYP